MKMQEPKQVVISTREWKTSAISQGAWAWVCRVSSVPVSSELRQSLLDGEEMLIRQEIKETTKVQETPDPSTSLQAASQGY